MTRAYNKIYLPDATTRLSLCFDYAVNDCEIEADTFAQLFVVSCVAEQFERGNPAYLSGMSGIEMAREVILKTMPSFVPKQAIAKEGAPPEYWAGWALAQYQWHTGRRFRDIFTRIPLSQIIKMYRPFHEMDIRQFIDHMEELYAARQTDLNLKRIRERRGLSQSELAREADVSLRNIQAYEQGTNSIDKAQAATLHKLSRVLGCQIEDLLENP